MDILTAPIRPSIDGFVLVQADGESALAQDVTAESDDASAVESEVPEEILLEFLSDPQAFVADPENAAIIAAVVRQVIVRDPESVDTIMSLVDEASDPGVIEAIADGIAQASSDIANAGNTDASSQLLAAVAVASPTLSAEVVSKAAELASVSEAETPITDAETLSEPAADAPSLATEQATGTGGVDNNSGSTSSTSSTPEPSSLSQSPTPMPPTEAANILSNTSIEPELTPGPIPAPSSPVVN